VTTASIRRAPPEARGRGLGGKEKQTAEKRKPSKPAVQYGCWREGMKQVGRNVDRGKSAILP